jgi:hypothetical protein
VRRRPLPEVEASVETQGRARRRPSLEAEAGAEAWGRARRSSLLRPRPNSGKAVTVVSLSLVVGTVAEQGKQCCFPVRTVSERAK